MRFCSIPTTHGSIYLRTAIPRPLYHFPSTNSLMFDILFIVATSYSWRWECEQIITPLIVRSPMVPPHGQFLLPCGAQSVRTEAKRLYCFFNKMRQLPNLKSALFKKALHSLFFFLPPLHDWLIIVQTRSHQKLYCLAAFGERSVLRLSFPDSSY